MCQIGIDYLMHMMYYHITVAWLQSGSAPAPMRWSRDYSSADHTAGARIEPPGSFLFPPATINHCRRFLLLYCSPTVYSCLKPLIPWSFALPMEKRHVLTVVCLIDVI